jgi:hypothetical protein
MTKATKLRAVSVGEMLQIKLAPAQPRYRIHRATSHWNATLKRLIAAGKNKTPTSPKVVINTWLVGDPSDPPILVDSRGE